MNKTVVIILCVVGGLILLGLTCVGGLIGFGVWAGTQPPPEGITLDMDIPDAIYAGDTFDLVLTIRNDKPNDRTLVDVDFWSPLLDGVSVTTVDPQPNRVDETFLSTYSFNRTIPASGEIIITFSAQADAPGVYAGDLDVSVDSMMSVLSTQQVITIYNAEDKP
jgi:hypothetical protein